MQRIWSPTPAEVPGGPRPGAAPPGPPPAGGLLPGPPCRLSPSPLSRVRLKEVSGPRGAFPPSSPWLRTHSQSSPWLSHVPCLLPFSPQASLGPRHEHQGRVQFSVPQGPSSQAWRGSLGPRGVRRGQGLASSTSVCCPFMCWLLSGPPLSLTFQPKLQASGSSELSGVEERACGRGRRAGRKTGPGALCWPAAPSDSLLGPSPAGLGRPSNVPGLPPFPLGS